MTNRGPAFLDRRRFLSLAAGVSTVALTGTSLRAFAQPADWQAVWDKTVAAAKKEGKVIVCMSSSRSRRDFLLKQWKMDYPEIELSLSPVSGSRFVPSVATERAAERYLWDVWNSGPNSGAQAIKAGLLDPLLPELILPEVSDPEIWGGWDDAFYDSERKYILGLVIDLVSPYYDAKVIAPERAEKLGLKLLLEPEFKGRIAWFEPRGEGPGAPFLPLIERVLGADALYKLIKDQEPVFVGSQNDIAQAIVRGKAVIGLGGNPTTIFKQYIDAGMKIDIRALGNTPTTTYRSTDGSTIAVFNKRPHPNAARVFVNWMMSKRISELTAKATDYDSRRRDVQPLDPNHAAIRGEAYFDAQRDENDATIRKWVAEVKRLRPQ